jgi:hypothetical protein
VRKLAAQGGAVRLGMVGAGTAAKRTAQTGTAALGLVARGSVSKASVAVLGTVAFGLTGAATAFKRATAAGLAALGLGGQVAEGIPSPIVPTPVPTVEPPAPRPFLRAKSGSVAGRVVRDGPRPGSYTSGTPVRPRPNGGFTPRNGGA